MPMPMHAIALRAYHMCAYAAALAQHTLTPCHTHALHALATQPRRVVVSNKPHPKRTANKLQQRTATSSQKPEKQTRNQQRDILEWERLRTCAPSGSSATSSALICPAAGPAPGPVPPHRLENSASSSALTCPAHLPPACSRAPG